VKLDDIVVIMVMIANRTVINGGLTQMPVKTALDQPTRLSPLGPTLSPKDEVRALLDRLPETVTLEDIRYHLDVVIKVYEAEAGIADGKFITHEEASRRFASWFKK
jgi:hypothetical protein